MSTRAYTLAIAAAVVSLSVLACSHAARVATLNFVMELVEIIRKDILPM